MSDTTDTATPAERLEQLKKYLKDAQDASAKNAKSIEVLKAQIAELTKTIADIEKKKQELAKTAGDVTPVFGALHEFVHTEKQKLTPVVEEEAVRQKLDDAKYVLTGLETAADAADQLVKDNRTALDDAAATTAQDQRVLATLIALPASLKAAADHLGKIRKQAEDKELAGNLRQAYFLVLVIEELLADVVVPTAAEYEAALNDAGSAAATAANAERDAKVALDVSIAKAKAARKAFDEADAKGLEAFVGTVGEGRGPDEDSDT